MHMKLEAQQRFCQKGVAMVEFAIVLPLLLTLIFATAELGRAIYQFNTLSKSVRDATRYLANVAIVDGTNLIKLGESEETTKKLVVYGASEGSNSPLLPGFAIDSVFVSSPDSVHVRVQASYTFQSLFGGNIPTFGLTGENINAPVTLTAVSTMRAL